MNKKINRGSMKYRSQLLITASAILLVGTDFGPAVAGSGQDRPQFWLELGWQFAQIGGKPEGYSPPFFQLIDESDLPRPANAEDVLAWSYGGEGTISYEPKGTDWIFSASALFGRAQGHKHVHQQDPKPDSPPSFPLPLYVFAQRYVDTKASNTETHIIADFEAGKDIGLGLLSNGGSAVASFGIRFAHFRSQTGAKVLSDPDFAFYKGPFFPPFSAYLPLQHYHAFDGEFHADRTFQGIGPEISLKASSPIAGEPSGGEISLDWGANAAVLFGRQNNEISQRTTAYQNRPEYHMQNGTPKYVEPYYNHTPAPIHRHKSIVVPNVGGFAAISANWSVAKISVGYRADFFFGAIDGGTDTYKSKMHSFSGPFATISIGVSPSDL